MAKEKKVTKEEKLTHDLEYWKNEYYRAYADMQNLRKHIEADHKAAMKYRIEGFVSDLLPVLDSFYLALKNPAESKELQNFLVGFQFVYRNLVQILENEGVTEISPNVGDKFDANLMQAVEVEPGEQDDVITKVNMKGYKLHDHLIRPAMVNVSTTKKSEEEKPQEEVKEEPKPEENIA